MVSIYFFPVPNLRLLFAETMKEFKAFVLEDPDTDCKALSAEVEVLARKFPHLDSMTAVPYLLRPFLE